MLYLVSDASRPVRFLSAGNLNNEDQFLHSKRTIQSYEVSTVYEETPEAALFSDESCPRYILPETGMLSANSRVNVLFVQLLDLAKRLGSLSSTQCSYAQSTLLLEVTH